MKATLVLALTFFISATAFAASQSDDANNLAAQKAREDYRVYLEQLKALSQQYKEVTGQMKDVIREEGYPVFDENTGDIRISHELSTSSAADFSLNDPSVQVQENDKEMTVVLQLPGLDRNSLKVSISGSGEDQILDVKGVRKADGMSVEKHVLLPAPAEEEARQTAKYEDGMLTVTIRKAKPSKKEIPVS